MKIFHLYHKLLSLFLRISFARIIIKGNFYVISGVTAFIVTFTLYLHSSKNNFGKQLLFTLQTESITITDIHIMRTLFGNISPLKFVLILTPEDFTFMVNWLAMKSSINNIVVFIPDFIVFILDKNYMYVVLLKLFTYLYIFEIMIHIHISFSPFLQTKNVKPFLPRENLLDITILVISTLFMLIGFSE